MRAADVWTHTQAGTVRRARICSLADRAVVEQVPYKQLLPAWSILGALEASSAASPGKPAIVVADQSDPARTAGSFTYAELVGLVRATANRLRAVSDGAPPVVSILTPLIPEAFIAAWAGATAGTANPINPFLRIDHIAQIMNAAKTTVAVCGSASEGRAAWVDVAQLGAKVPSLRAIWYVQGEVGPDAFYRQIEHARADRLEFELKDDPDATSALLHTGGTTAAPKIVRLTQAGQLLNAWCFGACMGSQADRVVANGMPYFHVGGLTLHALSSMLFGQTMLIVGPEGYRSPSVLARFWDMVHAHGVTTVGSAPTTAAALVANSNGDPPADFSYWSGGSTVPIQVSRDFREKFGIRLHEGWGMTEVQGALMVNPFFTEPREGSIGIPLPYHRVCCVPTGLRRPDPDSPANAFGLLSVSGPCVTPGYLSEDHNRELFFESDAQGRRWLNTGDLCTIDQDGYVWLRGRAKDLIIRGAHNIDPLIIEDALLSHPGVLYAAAIGEPDVEKGEMPIAYVQVRPGAVVDEPQLLRHCQSEIPERAAVPRSVRIIDAMPVTAVGKIFKPALRRDAMERCVRETVQSLGFDDSLRAEVKDTGQGLCVSLINTGRTTAHDVERLRAALERFAFRVELDRGK